MTSISHRESPLIGDGMTTEDTYRGIVHGSTIELQQAIGVPDGAEVEIVIKPNRLTDEQRKEKLVAAFGGCSEDANDLDEFLDWNERQRKLDQTDQS